MAKSGGDDFDDLFENDGIGEELDNVKENVEEITNNEGNSGSVYIMQYSKVGVVL